MIKDRRRIANKLFRIQLYLKAQTPVVWEAVEDVDRLRRAASYDPQWKREGFESEAAWAKHIWDNQV